MMPTRVDRGASAGPADRAGLGVLRGLSPASLARGLLRRGLAIPDDASTCRSRGFRVTSEAVRARLDAIGRSFAAGYRAGLEAESAEALAPVLDRVDGPMRGFAYEGASMSLALRDRLRPFRGGLVRSFLEGPGSSYTHVVHVGVGWAQARLWRPPGSLPPGLHPLLRWLVVDGRGFHQGFFRWKDFVDRRTCRSGEDPAIQSVLDQGLGRSLWFVEGADPDRIARTITGFPAGRQPDLWSGVGLACAYAGGALPAEIESLREASGPSRLHLAQGACFAAEARALAGNPTDDGDVACRILCGLGAQEAAGLARSAQPRSSGDPAPVSLYLDWRRAVRDALHAEHAG